MRFPLLPVVVVVIPRCYRFTRLLTITPLKPHVVEFCGVVTFTLRLPPLLRLLDCSPLAVDSVPALLRLVVPGCAGSPLLPVVTISHVDVALLPPVVVTLFPARCCWLPLYLRCRTHYPGLLICCCCVRWYCTFTIHPTGITRLLILFRWIYSCSVVVDLHVDLPVVPSGYPFDCGYTFTIWLLLFVVVPGTIALPFVYLVVTLIDPARTLTVGYTSHITGNVDSRYCQLR